MQPAVSLSTDRTQNVWLRKDEGLNFNPMTFISWQSFLFPNPSYFVHGEVKFVDRVAGRRLVPISHQDSDRRSSEAFISVVVLVVEENVSTSHIVLSFLYGFPP